jgi:hypothetical protein
MDSKTTAQLGRAELATPYGTPDYLDVEPREIGDFLRDKSRFGSPALGIEFRLVWKLRVLPCFC